MTNPTPLTVQQLDEIAARVNAAEDGWHVVIDGKSGRVSEPTTLVEFHLEDVDGGTLLTVTESGFDSMPPEYHDAAYRGNEGGWSQQIMSIERYLAEAA